MRSVGRVWRIRSRRDVEMPGPHCILGIFTRTDRDNVNGHTDDVGSTHAPPPPQIRQRFISPSDSTGEMFDLRLAALMRLRCETVAIR